MSTPQAFLCSENYIKNYTPVSSAVDVALLWPHMVTAQDLQVQDILGVKLMDELKTAIVNSTVSADQQTLIELCRPIIAWACLYYALPSALAQFRNKGLLENNSANSNPPDIETMKYLRNEASNNMEFYKKKVLDWLCLNGKKFSSYTQPSSLGYPNSETPFDSDLYLGPSNFDDYRDTIEFYKRYIWPY